MKYKVFRADVIKNIQIKSNRFDFEPEITAKVLKRKYKLYEMPISYYGRDFSEGKKITCKECGTLLRVPGESSPAEARKKEKVEAKPKAKPVPPARS